MMVTIKLDNGFEFEVSENIFLSWKFARLIGDVETNSTPSTITKFLRYVLKDNLESLEDYLENHLGREVLTTDMIPVISEIGEKLGSNEQIKKS